VPSQFQSILQNRTQNLTSQITSLSEVGENSLLSITKKIASLTEQFQMTDAKRLEYEAFQKDKQLLEDAVSALQTDINQIETVIEPALANERNKRLELYLDFFDLLQEEKASLDKLYEPLQAALKQGTDTDKKLEFVSKIAFDVSTHARKAFDLIDSRRRTKYKDKETLEHSLRSLISRLENIGYERNAAKAEVIAFRDSFLKDDTGKAITIGEQLRKDKTEEEFNNWFYDVEPFVVRYSMRFDDKDLNLLSPGQKGIVLLLVYLEVDQDDRRPLIVDQPEDNLDNLSIYSNLVQYFRKRKKTRQIIIITHNPNLVVNTDSEQVIIADYDGARKPRIVYTSGSLENTSTDTQKPGVRERVCSILEGGSEAFRKREQKYALPIATI
jgi:chromosome segregation ATPase